MNIEVTGTCETEEVPCTHEVDCGWMHQRCTGRHFYRVWALPIPKWLYDLILNWMIWRTSRGH